MQCLAFARLRSLAVIGLGLAACKPSNGYREGVRHAESQHVVTTDTPRPALKNGAACARTDECAAGQTCMSVGLEQSCVYLLEPSSADQVPEWVGKVVGVKGARLTPLRKCPDHPCETKPCPICDAGFMIVVWPGSSFYLDPTRQGKPFECKEGSMDAPSCDLPPGEYDLIGEVSAEHRRGRAPSESPAGLTVELRAIERTGRR